MKRLLRFPSSIKRDPAIEVWMRNHSDELGAIAQRWFEVMRACGDDVRELMHDGQPTACVGDAAFAYVAVFKAHVDIVFFPGSEIADPYGLLEGAGKFMRHVKLTSGRQPNAEALTALIEAAYAEVKNMTLNKQTVETYMEGFRRADHRMILDCLNDDVEWIIPGMFHIRGKEAFDREIENDQFIGKPVIAIARMLEENDVVVAEGTVRAQRKDGAFFELAICDVFDMRDGKISRLVSYLMAKNA